MTKSVVDVNIIRQLELSRKIVGKFNSVIKDWDREVLSGSHRNQAGWKKTHKIDSRALAKEWQINCRTKVHARLLC